MKGDEKLNTVKIVQHFYYITFNHFSFTYILLTFLFLLSQPSVTTVAHGRFWLTVILVHTVSTTLEVLRRLSGQATMVAFHAITFKTISYVKFIIFLVKSPFL